MAHFGGFLFSRLGRIGTKSEGPDYYLQEFDYSEVPIIKRTELWTEDPTLQKHLASKVALEGEWVGDGILYESVGGLDTDRQPMLQAGLQPKLKPDVALQLDRDTVWINKMPSPAPPVPCPRRLLVLTLKVRWPYRSIWRGECPTSQKYDFWIEREGQPIWQWSADKAFLEVITPVEIPGGDWHSFPEDWVFDPDAITEEGVYTARTKFIATGTKRPGEFEIKFAY